MDHIIIHCPQEALNKLEEVSYLLKHKDTVACEEFLKMNEHHRYCMPADEETKSATSNVITESKKFFKVSSWCFADVFRYRTLFHKLLKARKAQKKAVVELPLETSPT